MIVLKQYMWSLLPSYSIFHIYINWTDFQWNWKWVHEASGLYSYLVARFEGSAVQPQSGVSQSGPAKNVSEMTKSDQVNLSHCCPLQGWSDTT